MRRVETSFVRGRECATLIGAVAVALALAGCGSGSEGVESSQTAHPRGCAKTYGLDLGKPSKAELNAALHHRFQVFNLHRRLIPPVNWLQDPEHSHRYRQNLQKLRFLRPLLAAYEERRDRRALHEALALGLDWVRANPRGGATTSPDAWEGKANGDRLPFLGFLDSAAHCEHLQHAAKLLDASLVAHGRALADPAVYTPNNHGLFTDIGLYLVTRYASGLPQDDRWRRLALTRYADTLQDRLSQGVWLEHSSSYQFLVETSLSNFLKDIGHDRRLERLDRRMRQAGGWFVEPDGRISLLGDSDEKAVSPWAKREAESNFGLKMFREAGFAFVRAHEPGGATGYLTVTDGYHNNTHKHADELSFELYDHGQRVVADSGLYDKDPGPVRDFDLSAQAHSTLTIDGRSYPIADPSAVYGSGLEAAGDAEGIYAIEGRNRMLSQEGVEQTRLFLYEPGTGMQVIDWISAPSEHSYDSYLQLGPNVRTAKAGGGLSLSADGLDGELSTWGTTTPSITTVRGSRRPLAGFTSPQFRVLIPRTTVDMHWEGTSSVQSYSLALDPSAPRVEAVHGDPHNAVVNLVDGSGAQMQTIRVRRNGSRLDISIRQ